MELSGRTLTALAGGLGFVLLVTLILVMLQRQSRRAANEESVTAAEMATAPGAGSAATPAARSADPSSPFAAVADDPKGYDGTAWGAAIANVAKRRDKVTTSFTNDSGAAGEPGLATVIWVGIGLPPNHQAAQASTFDAASMPQAEFRTLARGGTQYIFDKGSFVMAVNAVPAIRLERIRQQMGNQNQVIPSLHIEQTFDFSPPGSGLPPEALSSDCYKKAGTNTRIYVIEKWSTSVQGAVMNDHGYVVTIPDTAYEALLAQAQQPR